jgi:4-amino-4-deoxy-L-arabinose transferase-like glycosyltransferase
MATALAHRRWRTITLACAVAALCGVHGPILANGKLADVDEGYALAIAERLLEGFKLYDGAVSQRGPLMYYGYAAMARLTGWDSVIGLRAWALAFAIGNVLLVYWAGARLFSRPVGVVAALIVAYALGFGMPPRDAIALHGEAMQLPLLVVSVVLGALAMRQRSASRRRALRLAVSGLFLGASICVKQSVALHPLPLLAWIVIDAHKNRARKGTLLAEASTFVAAVLVIPALFAVHAYATGTLGELYYYCVRYNLSVHLRPSKSPSFLLPVFAHMNEQTSFFLGVVLLVALALPFSSRRVRAAWRSRSGWALLRAHEARVYLGLHLAIALGTGASMVRFFPHYFLQALPFLALLVAASLARTLEARRMGATARRVTAVGAAFLLAFGGLAAYFGEKLDGRIGHDTLVERLAKYIEAATTPDQRVFVWGFSPWLYPYSHRRPAGRYVFETYVTGFVPWFFDDPAGEKARIVPGSVDALLDDLDREKPALVIDAGAVMIARPMRAYDRPAAWLHEHYCFSFRFGSYDVYERKGDRPCFEPSFPQAAAPVNFYGGALPVLMPPLVDADTSWWLPPGEPDKPVQFLGQPVPKAIDAIRDLKREREVRETLEKYGWQSH